MDAPTLVAASVEQWNCKNKRKWGRFSMARWCQGHSGGRWVHSELSEKTTLQLSQSQNGLNGLRTNSWFWLPSNSQAGGPQWWDSPRERGEGGGGWRADNPAGFLCGKCSSERGKAWFHQISPPKDDVPQATQPGNPNTECEAWRAASEHKAARSAAFSRGDIRSTNMLALAQHGSVLRTHTHWHTEFGCT